MSGTADERGGDTLKGFKDFFLKARPESGRACLVCGTFSQQRPSPIPLRYTSRKEALFQFKYLHTSTFFKVARGTHQKARNRRFGPALRAGGTEAVSLPVC